MARIKVFAEIEVALDLDIDGIDSSTPEHEVQQHREEVLAALRGGLETAFGAQNFRKFDYVEFDVERPSESTPV